MLAPLALVLHSLGAPIGEAVAEDFDFLHRAFLERGGRTLLDGGGSTAFWRPVAHQLYYQSIGSLILAHPGLVATLHVLMLALASLLLYRAFRRTCSGPAAALIATFPLLSESSRTWICWPSHFVDLGAWLFTALALHETAARRLWSALLALLLALGCKEVAVVAALFLPWMPGTGPRGVHERTRWAFAMGATTGLWALAYLAVRHHNGLALPHHLEASISTAETPWMIRFGWSLANSLRALFSLPAAHVAGEMWIVAAGTTLAAVAAALVLGRRGAYSTLRSAVAPIAWGTGWFFVSSATLMVIYPMWMPNRSGYGSLGFGAACAGLLGATHPLLLAGLVALRLVTFALGPAAPAIITPEAPETGAFMDFVHLSRLQHLMRDSRTTLMRRYPTLPAGSIVGQHYLPRHAEYAFGGDKALQVWYRDTTLHWVKYDYFSVHPELPLVTIVEFQSVHIPQMALVEPAAMRSFLSGFAKAGRAAWDSGLVDMARADSLQRDPNAKVFLGSVAGERALAWMALGRSADALREARRGGALWPENNATFYVAAIAAYQAGDLATAESEVDSVLRYIPDHTGALDLRLKILDARAAQR